ncbi:MetQ/NlpA family ABC transporter substrate-binding protein [Georgenia faecalis]|uniref:Lipoprotein n=1 Tax=Georgenia faecalis TaxID=2483799 RepID=A0ABV9D9E7_9MICO|nr:MetQ/NlpA family ABC transporter substrate-binding protein [Georgenia faecalis]
MRPTRYRAAALTAAVAMTMAACSGEESGGSEQTDGTTGGVTTLTVGASVTPHAEILEFVDDELAADAGIDLEIVEYTDYIQPNVQLAEGQLDANFFQHLPYYEAEVEEKGYEFEHFDGVHIEPFGVYSSSVTDLEDLPDGAQIGVPNDPSNQARALELLQEGGVFALADVENPSVFDIAENPKNVELVELEAAQLVRTLEDFDAAVINGNYALEGGLNPAEDALVLEPGEDNPYANLVAVRAEDVEDPAILTLDELLHSDEVRDFISERWPAGEIVPAF